MIDGTRNERDGLDTVQIVVHNDGPGKAFEIDGTHGIIATATSLPAGATFNSWVRLSRSHPLGPGSQTFFLFYQSLDGRKFRTETNLVNGTLIIREDVSEMVAGKFPASLEEAFKSKGQPGTVT